MTKFSVIVPMYNASRTIRKCVESITNQSFKDYEVIFVDDCSVDGSPDIVREYGVKVIRTRRNSGPAAARNLGVRHSKGEIICFTDSDCIVPENWLSVIKGIFDKTGADIVSGMMRNANQKSLVSRFIGYEKNACFSELGANDFFCGTFNTAIKREVFNSVKFDETIRDASYEDVKFAFQIRKLFKCVFSKESCVYHINTDSLKTYAKKHFRKAFGHARLFASGYVIESFGPYSRVFIHRIILSSMLILFLLMSLFNPVFMYTIMFLVPLYILVNRAIIIQAVRNETLLGVFLVVLILFFDGFIVTLGVVTGIISKLVPRSLVS